MLNYGERRKTKSKRQKVFQKQKKITEVGKEHMHEGSVFKIPPETKEEIVVYVLRYSR